MTERSASARTPLERVVLRIGRFNIALGSASGVATLLMILLIVPDVFARALFSYTIPMAAEIGVFLLIGMIFLGLPGVQAAGENFHVTALVERLSPRARRGMRILTSLVSTLVIALLAFYSIDEAINSTLSGEATYGVDPFPVWPQRIMVAIGLVLLSIQFLVDTIALLAESRGDGSPSSDRA